MGSAYCPHCSLPVVQEEWAMDVNCTIHVQLRTVRSREATLAQMYQQEVLGLQGVPAGCAAPSAPAMQAIKEAWGRLQLGEQTPRLASTNGTPSTTGSSSTWAMICSAARCATGGEQRRLQERFDTENGLALLVML